MIWRIPLKFRPLWWLNADTQIAEVMSALVALSWAGVLLWPGDTMAAAPALRVMARMGGDLFWLPVFVLVWLVQSLAMCGNVRIFRYPGALLSLALWTFVGTTTFFSNPLSPGWAVYAILALAMLWTLISGPTDHDSRTG